MVKTLHMCGIRLAHYGSISAGTPIESLREFAEMNRRIRRDEQNNSPRLTKEFAEINRRIRQDEQKNSPTQVRRCDRNVQRRPQTQRRVVAGIYLGYISGTSRVYLGHFSGISRAYLGHFSALPAQLLLGVALCHSRLDLGHISGISRAYLGYISGTSRLYLRSSYWALRCATRG